MLSFNQALAQIKEQSRCLAQTVQIPLEKALNRFLAEDVFSPISMPPLPNSAMDGYAIDANDWQANQSFSLSISCAAGEKAKTLEVGHAARIFTGAIIPSGANAVIPQELATLTDNTLIVEKPVHINQFVRLIGEDFKQGDKLLNKGERLGHRQILLLANAGIDKVITYRPLRIALLATGDELLPLGAPWQAGKIYDSNRPCIQSLLQQWGMEVCLTKVIGDDLNKTKKTLLEASVKADLIITTGGVSVGDKDFIKQAIDAIGEISTWRINIKPGKPIALGKVGDIPFIGLPGNPVSALNTLLLLARPIIYLSQGAHEKYIDPLIYHVAANFTYQAGNRHDFLRARLSLPESGRLSDAVIDIFDRQQSHIVSSFHWAKGLASIPANSTIKPGDLVQYYPYETLMS